MTKKGTTINVKRQMIRWEVSNSYHGQRSSLPNIPSFYYINQFLRDKQLNRKIQDKKI